MKRLLLVSAVMLSGCQAMKGEPENKSLASDGMPRSICANCTLTPFYVNGHWREGR